MNSCLFCRKDSGRTCTGIPKQNGQMFRKSCKEIKGCCGPFFKWKKRVVSRMSSVMTEKIKNISSPTVQRKARKDAEVFATIRRHWNHGKNTNLKAVQSKWPGIWGSNFWMRSNIFSFKNWRNWIQKHPAGCVLLPTSGIWAVLFSGIGDSDGYSFITTERNPIIHPEDFAGF